MIFSKDFLKNWVVQYLHFGFKPHLLQVMGIFMVESEGRGRRLKKPSLRELRLELRQIRIKPEGIYNFIKNKILEASVLKQKIPPLNSIY